MINKTMFPERSIISQNVGLLNILVHNQADEQKQQQNNFCKKNQYLILTLTNYCLVYIK